MNILLIVINNVLRFITLHIFTKHMTDDTCWTVEHPKAVSMVMTKELADNNVMIFLNKLYILLIELRPEPWLMSFLLKKTRRDMTHNVHLIKEKEEVLFIWTLYNTNFHYLPFVDNLCNIKKNVTFSLFLTASVSTWSAHLNWSAGSFIFSVILFWS